MAGLSIPVFFRRLTPRWIPILGLILAAIGKLSWLNFEIPSALLLIPLNRFPGFIWDSRCLPHWPSRLQEVLNNCL